MAAPVNASPADYVVRAARAGDLAAFLDMKRLTGPGLTSLSGPDETLAVYLEKSGRAFAAPTASPSDHFFLALEHRPSGAIVGMAQVKAAVGLAKPFFNYRLLRLTNASAAAKRRFELDVLMPVNEFAGSTEIGTLFVRPEHRGAGIGGTLSRARFMMMAAAPKRFAARVIAELRGVVSAEGVSPFWEHLGRLFFRMSFTEADQLSATSDNQFIIDLMPKYPIYVDLLPGAARAVIGQAHPDGQGARKLLEREGFAYDNVIDIFDGGPLVSAARDAIDTVRRARLRIVRAGEIEGRATSLLAHPDLVRFACAASPIEDRGDHVCAPAAILQALALDDGAQALVCPPP